MARDISRDNTNTKKPQQAKQKKKEFNDNNSAHQTYDNQAKWSKLDKILNEIMEFRVCMRSENKQTIAGCAVTKYEIPSHMQLFAPPSLTSLQTILWKETIFNVY